MPAAWRPDSCVWKHCWRTPHERRARAACGLLAALDGVHATAGRLGAGVGTPAALIDAVHAALAAINALPPQASASAVRDGAAVLARVRRDLHQRHATAGCGLDTLGLTQVLAGPRSAGLRDRG